MQLSTTHTNSSDKYQLSTAPLRGSPLHFVTPDGLKKTRMTGVPWTAKKSGYIVPVSMQYTNVTDGRTDRRTTSIEDGYALTYSVAR